MVPNRPQWLHDQGSFQAIFETAVFKPDIADPNRMFHLQVKCEAIRMV